MLTASGWGTSQVHTKVTGLAGVFAGVAVAVAFMMQQRRKKGTLPLPPSPSGDHWLFGHLLHLPDPVSGDHMDLTFLEWLKEVGGTYLVRFPPLVQRLIVVGDPELARYVLSTRNFPKSWTYKGILPIIGRKSFLVAEGEQWSGKRRALNAGFSPNAVDSLTNVLESKISRLISRCQSAAESGEVLRMHDASHDFAMDVITQVAVGENWHGTDLSLRETIDNMKALIEECTLILSGGGTWNPLRWLRVWRLEASLNTGLARLVRRRCALLRHNPSSLQHNPDLLSLSIRAASPCADTRALSADEVEDVVSQLKTFFFAGHDTSASVIAWALWLLALHPDACRTLRAEVAATLLPTGWDPASRASSAHVRGESAPSAPAPGSALFSALRECSFLEAVVKEALRLYPPAATARFVAEAGEEYAGQSLGGAVVVVSAYVMHRNPQLWARPDHFLPHRWLDQASDGAKEQRGAGEERGPPLKAVSEWAYMPFSRGPRDCIGRHLAMVETMLAVAAVVASFDLTPEEPERERVIYRVTSRPLHGCRLRLCPLPPPSTSS